MLQQRPPFPSGVMDCILPKQNNCGALFLSGVEAAINPILLEQNQIGAILTVGTEMAQLKFTDAVHKILHLHDTQHDPIKQHFYEAIQFIDDNRKSSNVLVHCFVGVSRSATIIIAYLMQIYNFPLQKAINHLRQSRPLINPNPGFIQQLQAFDQELLRKRLSQLRPPSVDNKNSIQQNRKDSVVSYRQTVIPMSPLRKVNAPGQTRQSSLTMTPSSVRRICEQNNIIERGTINNENNFCKSLNSSLCGEFRKTLQQSNQYHSAKKSTNEYTGINQIGQFCKTYSAHQTQNGFTQQLQSQKQGNGIGIGYKGRYPSTIKNNKEQQINQ